MPAKETFTIGELATRAGMTADALRYYERLGVIARVPRTTGGFRAYPAAVVDRLRFIKQAQPHGLFTEYLVNAPPAWLSEFGPSAA